VWHILEICHTFRVLGQTTALRWRRLLYFNNIKAIIYRIEGFEEFVDEIFIIQIKIQEIFFAFLQTTIGEKLLFQSQKLRNRCFFVALFGFFDTFFKILE
jgi:hypothetical protein